MIKKTIVYVYIIVDEVNHLILLIQLIQIFKYNIN